LKQTKAQIEDLRTRLRKAEQWSAWLESFISSITDGVVFLDADGNVVVTNDACKTILDIPSDEPLEVWPSYEQYTLEGEPISSDDLVWSRALRGETVRDARYRVRSRRGKEVVINISSAPVWDSKERIIGAVIVFRDVTDELEIERIRREVFDREHRISQMLQQALIPSEIPYDLKGISIAARYQPALREAEVGGDFYDVFVLGDDKIGVLVGDVAGKGLKAAVRVAAARYTIRSYAYLEPSPGDVLTLANTVLLKEDPDMDSLLTAFLGVLDVAKCTITYACAGHEPPVVCGDNEVEELCVTGMMLGAMEDSIYTDETRKLHSGESVVIFTDGITEARRDGTELWGKEGVINHLAGICDLAPDEIAQSLLQAAADYSGGSLQDDAVIVVLGIPYNNQE
jgi:PAS domain S-box-containing protein